MPKPQDAPPPPLEHRDAPSGAPAGVSPQATPGTGPQKPSAWNPYEVWRTRVKGPEDSNA